MTFIDEYLNDAVSILKSLDKVQIEKIIQILLKIRQERGRLFFLGVGGSAANCIHAVNDFRKLTHIESYTPVDNIAELTARTNDEGWPTVFIEWLKVSRLGEKDGVFVLSVGGGDKERDVSANIVYALEYARQQNAKIVGIVGRNGGFTAKVADACLIIPSINPKTITPHVESFQSIIWHLIAADSRLAYAENKWESMTSVVL